MTGAEIAERIGGVLEGDGSVEIKRVAGLKEAKAGDISFLSNPRYAAEVGETQASAVIVNEAFEGGCSGTVIRVQNADAAFGEVAALLAPERIMPEPGTHATAVVADDVVLGQDVSIGPHCVLESGVTVGDRTVISAGCVLGYRTLVGSDCLLHSRVSVREDTRIGDRVILHNGAVIGSDGFGYSRGAEGWKKIPQVGHVEIGDDVEIGANTTIDRARFGVTVIGNGVKIDNLVQVAHNVRIGDHTALAAQVGISGSTTVGKHVQMGGQAGVSGHICIGDGVILGGQAGALKDLAPNAFYSGYPAMPHKKSAQAHAHMMRIPALKKRVKALEERIAELEGSTGDSAG